MGHAALGTADRAKVMLFEMCDDEKAFEARQQIPHFKKHVAEAGLSAQGFVIAGKRMSRRFPG